MAKNKISEYSVTSADNTDISNINIAEGCSPANVNNAIRTVMAQLKDFQSGSATYYTSDSDALAVAAGGTGAITASTARTNLSAAKSGANSDITSLTGLTTPLSVAQGGTGASTSATAAFALKGANADITSITGLTTALTVAQGGTGSTSLTANSVVLGNGTSALSANLIAPSTSGNVLTSNGTTWTSAANYKLTSGTSVTASGTSVGFTGIPSWVKRITVMFQSLIAPAVPSIVLGTSGGLVTTGYLGSVISENTTNNTVNSISTGFSLNNAGTLHGAIVFTNITGNTWIGSGTMGYSNSQLIGYVSGSIALSGTLTQLAITSGSAFTSGNINIMYE